MSDPASLLRFTALLPPISLNIVDESEAQKDVPMRQVVHRWRTEWVPIDQPVLLTPVPTERVIPNEIWSTCYDVPTPPPSLMPIPDEVFYSGPKSAFAEERGPPQATAPSLIPIYHRSRTEWIRQGDPFALTPGFHLEEFNAHVCEPRSTKVLSWVGARAQTPKKE